MIRKFLLSGLMALSALAGAQTTTGNAPFRLVVPFPTGDGLESAARVLADIVAKDLNTPIIIDNRVGASGVIAAEAVATAKDPRTLLIGTTAIMGITPFLRSVPYSPADFEPIAKFAHISAVMAIRNEIPAKNWAEFVALAKAEPRKFSYATPGEGTLTHLAVEAMSRHAGIEMLPVPYKGMGPALQDFLGGRVDFYTEPAVVPHVKSGKVRALAVNSDKRLPELPNVPTYDEAGIRAASTPWIGVLTTKAMPAEQREQLAAAFRKAVASPDFASKLPTGIGPAYASSTDFAKQIQAEQAFYKQFIATLNLKLQ